MRSSNAFGRTVRYGGCVHHSASAAQLGRSGAAQRGFAC